MTLDWVATGVLLEPPGPSQLTCKKTVVVFEFSLCL
eukprot:COSAG06_NODE_47659_length_337_cov_1.911765_1_plen_35_part_01